MYIDIYRRSCYLCGSAKITHHKVYEEYIYAILKFWGVSHLCAKIYIGF